MQCYRAELYTKILPEQLTTRELELSEYFEETLERIEELTPSGATVHAKLCGEDQSTEVEIEISSPDWITSSRKRSANPFRALDLASDDIKAHIFRRQDCIDFSFF